MKPTIGRIVIIRAPHANNGQDDVAGIITKVIDKEHGKQLNTETSNGSVKVNVTLFLDKNKDLTTMDGIPLYHTHDDANDAQTTYYATWPERV